jgi:hypothetical protein
MMKRRHPIKIDSPMAPYCPKKKYRKIRCVSRLAMQREFGERYRGEVAAALDWLGLQHLTSREAKGAPLGLWRRLQLTTPSHALKGRVSSALVPTCFR